MPIPLILFTTGLASYARIDLSYKTVPIPLHPRHLIGMIWIVVTEFAWIAWNYIYSRTTMQKGHANTYLVMSSEPPHTTSINRTLLTFFATMQSTASRVERQIDQN